MPTFVVAKTSSGAETLTDVLSATPVERVGSSGRVRAAFVSTLTTGKATLRGRESGRSVIPPGSGALVPGAITALGPDADDFIYEAQLIPNEALDCEIVAAGAQTAIIAVITN